MAQTVTVIRHAEKPGGKWPGPGLTEAGEVDEESLVVRGWQRAGGLALLFSGFGNVPCPQRVYASAVLKHDGTGKRSKRPLQTIAPLCRRLGMQPIDSYSKGDEAILASEVRSLEGTTLISWQHESIPDIIRALTGSFDQDWPESCFDMIRTLSRAAALETWSFKRSNQRLLSGDEGS